MRVLLLKFRRFETHSTFMYQTFEQMPHKIANVIDCLKTEPLSKRAVIPIPFTVEGSETVDWKDQV